MFITTNKNHSIRFILKNGVIVFLAYRFQYGNNALPFIQKMKSGIFSFKEDLFVGKDDPTLLDTDTLLQILGNTKTSPNLNKIEIKEEQNNTTLFTFDGDIDMIKKELSLFIGPIAQVIFEEYIDDYGKPSNHTELARMLATFTEEIDDEAKKEQFKQKLISLN